jgi:dipeptidyl aminopeptidase/acylaminoacyl peptidase
MGLDVLQKEKNVDPNRVALVGDSRGGMSALRTAAVDQRVKAVVGLAPPCDMKHNVRGTMLYAPMRHQTQLDMMGGEPDVVPERYERVQAISYADRIKVPVLLVHGLFDLHAPAEMSLYMERELKRYGHTDVTVELLEGLGHFWERQHWGDEHWRVVEIVRNWLLKKIGTPRMAPATARQ